MTTATQEPSIRIDFDARGGWEIDLDDVRLTCETLEDARRIATVSAARLRPCELIVRDAYHRVIERQHVAAERV